jgi:hypothetical protein
MKIVLPAQDEPLVLSGGGVNPIWYLFFQNLVKRGVLDMPDVDNSTPITDGEVLVYDGTAKKLKPGSN